MSDPILKLQILARAEMTLAQIRTRRTASRSAMFSVAVVFLLLGLGMMTIAVYQALIPTLGAPWAAFTVAMVDTLLGVIFVLVARRAGPSENEEKLVREIRDMAYGEIGRDVEEIRRDLEEMTAEVKKISSAVATITGGAVNTIGPALGALVKAVKRD